MSNRAIALAFRFSRFAALAAVGLALGCFRSSGVGDDDVPDAGARLDGRVADDAGSLADGGGATDICHCCGVDVEVPRGTECALGVCDPYCLVGECRGRPLDALCDYGFVPAGESTHIPVLFGDPSGESCFCTESLRCEARIVEEGTLELRTEICTDPLGGDCGECAPFVEGSCALPPLTEGSWRVTNGGQDAFELTVAPAGVAPEWGLSCRTSAGTDESCGTLWPPRPEPVQQVCQPSEARPGDRVAIEVTHPCPGCNAPAGPCAVDVFDDVIRVRTSTLDPACDIACPPVCVERVDTCLTPALPAGVWRVRVDGLAGYESTVRVGPGAGDSGQDCGPPHG